MAAPPSVALPFVPPLPPGWTEHQAPGGQPYYYHAVSGQSTYVRPLPAIIPGAAPKKKKERPRTKTPIPGTAWLRVITTEGNTFWTHKERKESLWEVPEEIKEQVEAMERDEREKEEREAAEKEEQERQERERAEEEHVREEQAEVQRVMDEVKDAVAAGKRKAEVALDDDGNGRKKARVEDAQDGGGGDEDEDNDDKEEALQREMAEEMAAEMDGAPPPEEEPTPAVEETVAGDDVYPATPSDEKPSAFKVPNRVDLSLDEAKALFKTLLQEKNINPMHPWDTSLPHFIKDPRYVLLPSVAARRDAFDEYCRDAVRAQRLARAAAQKTEAADPDPERAAYARLLREEVTSTRTTWNEFRRRWKKDRRYFAWAGERERERAFRDWVRELGEVKRKAAEKAEREFFQLLREHKEIAPGAVWKEVKRKIDPKDPRYDAVGSSSLREELFGTYVKTVGAQAPPATSQDAAPSNGDDADTHAADNDAATRRRQRAERAERERAETVQRQRAGLERELGRTRGAVGREEGEREFMTLLTDAVRDPQAIWDTTAPQLAHDPRFVLCALPAAVQRALFAAHVTRLQERPRAALHTLFAAHTPNLGTTWRSLSDEARAAVSGSAAAGRLGLEGGEAEEGEEGALEREFARWQRTRTQEGREAFDKMLGENAFLEFWGRMGKAGVKGLERAAVDEDEDEEGEGGGGRADLKRLAQSVDVGEVGKVLRGDARWTAFDHVPEQREQWLRDYMERLAAPKLSVHVPETS